MTRCSFCGGDPREHGCLFCGGDTREPDHAAHCDGRQGVVEAAYADQPVLDVVASELGKREGMARVEDGADDGFSDAALVAVAQVARQQRELVSDDVWKHLDARSHDNRALGPVMKQAQRDGLIAPTDRFVLTTQARRHRSPVRIWVSLVYGLLP
jgi:hypothetical protein